MRVIQRGHIYELEQRAAPGPLGGIDESAPMLIQFVNMEPGHEAAGTTTQEVMRVLIDRTHYCHNCLPHRVNEQIIWHMRQIIALHEARAIEQKAWKCELRPEFVPLGEDGHFKLGLDALNVDKPGSALEEYILKPVPKLGYQTCDHRSGG
jgi:hypothetical protein